MRKNISVIIKSALRKTVLTFFISSSILISSAQIENYFAGNYSGTSNTGSNCAGVGYITMHSGNSGNNNSAFGYASLYSNITGSDNTAVGYRSVQLNTTGYANTGIGTEALFSNTSGKYNTAIGYRSLYNNIAGVSNAASGYQSLFSNVNGTSNTATGYQSLYKTDGNFNSAFGYQSCYTNSAGFNNDAFGYKSLYSNTTGYYNTAIGDYALYYSSTANHNVALGYKAGYSRSNNNYCTYIGYASDASVSGIINATAIGYSAKVNGSNKVVIGNTSVTEIGGQVDWSKFSDGRFKKDIRQNVPGLSFINKLNPVTYHINQEKLERFLGSNDSLIQSMKNDFAASDKKLHTGFIAQEVEQVAKEINYDFDGVNIPQNDKSNYSLAYADFVPSLVKAVQELSKQNEALQKQVDAVEALMIAEQSPLNNQRTSVATATALQQNIPNPFSNSTLIPYTLPQTYTSAQIIITDRRGNVLKEVNISGNGKGNLKLEASLLASGAYQYALYVDDRLVEAKQMVILK